MPSTARMENLIGVREYLWGGIVLGLDQGSKFLVKSNISPFQKIEIIEQFLNFHHIQNLSNSLGVLEDSTEIVRTSFSFLVTGISIGIILNLYQNWERISSIGRMGLFSVLFGGIGNLLDRLLLGHVIDFISLPWYFGGFSVFNLADLFIVGGFLMVVFDLLKSLFKEANKKIRE